MTNRDNFRIWFADYIRSLASDRNAGFLITIVSFPLLERYVRQMTKAEPRSPKFTAGVLKVFPELKNESAAHAFWTTYRHGLLHNVTMSKETHGLTHDRPIVDIQPGGKVWLNPVLFADRVLSTIENDFLTFEAGTPALPVVNVYGRVPEHPGAPNQYQGTSTPPGKSGRP
jgi:hypothetical protein